MTPVPSGDAHELVGQQLGVYHIEAPLTVSGQADFFQARDLYTDQLVALKLLPASLSTSREAIARVRDEMRRVARLRHPHLLPVVEVAAERGLLYAIALLPVASLRDRFERDGLLPPQDAVRYAAELAWALHALHSAGLVHGDIQPANMLFDAQSGLRLADFGVARAIQRQQSKARRTAAPSRPLAVRSYMAPEVARGGEITARADIYSLGAVFYEMLIGTLPLVAPSGEDITTAPLPPSMRSSEDWPELAAVALKALAPDPARRYADARAFAVALRTAVFSQQREDQRPSLIAALSGVFHTPVEDASEGTFFQRITGAPVPSAHLPESPSAGVLDAAHLSYRATPPSVPAMPVSPPVSPPDLAFDAPSSDSAPMNEDEIATTLLNERLPARDGIATAHGEDDVAATSLDREQHPREEGGDMLPPPTGIPLPSPSIPPHADPLSGPEDGEIDLMAVWLAAIESDAIVASPADGGEGADDGTPVQDEELVDDLRRLASGTSRPTGPRSASVNPGWLKALLATLGVTVLAVVSGLGILASTHTPNAAPGGPAIPTATSAPTSTIAVATPHATSQASQPGTGHGSTYVFPTPTPIPPPPTATP